METITLLSMVAGAVMIVLCRRDQLWASFGLLLVLFGFARALQQEVQLEIRLGLGAGLMACTFLVARRIPTVVWRVSRPEVALFGGLAASICVAFFFGAMNDLVVYGFAVSACLLVAALVVMTLRRVNRPVE